MPQFWGQGDEVVRKAIFFRLKPGAAAEYARRHAEIPEEMRVLLSEAGYRNYSIWRFEDRLFAYFELDDEGKASKILGSSEVYKKWRRWMEEVVAVDPDGEKEWPMELVFLHER
jgi:L-rhamnose mutarotase